MGMLKALVHRFGALDGAPQMLQRLLVGDAPAILTYHAVIADPLGVPDWCFLDAQRFREQLRYLKQHCNIIRLREIPAAAQAPDHRPTIALTFDDGFRNNCTVAFPILRELELPATIFLTTDFVSSEDAPWFCHIHDAVATTTLEKLVWEGETYDLSSARARAIASARLQERVKSSPHRELLGRVAQLVTELGGRPLRPIEPDSPYRMLDVDEIREMAGTELIEFGAHTCSHAILSGLAPDERTREIAGSLTAVERFTQSRCDMFAYPNGRACDYGGSDVMALRERQVAVAVTTVEGPNDRSVAPLELRRYGVSAYMSFGEFKLRAHHLMWKLGG